MFYGLGVYVKNPLTTEQLYDLFLLGMWRLRQEREDILTRTATSVLGAYVGASVITKSQREALTKDYKLVTLVMKNANLIKGDRRPFKSKIVELIGELNEHLIVLITPEESTNFTKFFGKSKRKDNRDVYEFVITNSGIAHAASVESRYTDLVSPEKYFRGWLAHKQRAAAANAGNTSKGGQVTSLGASDSAVDYIPRAPYSESDFEF